MFDLPDRMPDAEQALHECGQFAQGDLAGGVGDGLAGVGVGFEEYAVGPGETRSVLGKYAKLVATASEGAVADKSL